MTIPATASSATALRRNWPRTLALPFGAGMLFALGLGLSGMTQPAKVLGFLDVAGTWDPSLAFVMGGAVGTYFLLLRLARRRADGTPRDAAPAPGASVPAPVVDRRTLTGSALFGIGWGLVGLCPGPALVSTTTGLPDIALFVAAMTGAMLAVRFLPVLWQRLRGSPAAVAPAAPQECGPAAQRAA